MNAKEDHPTELPKNPKRSPVKLSLMVAVVAVLIATGVIAGLIPRLGRRSELAAETRQLSVPTVAVVSPKPGQSDSGVPLPAEAKPWIEASIYARANGYLKRRLVDIGAHVQAGQPLAEIETPELDQDLERTRGQLAQAEAALGLSKITAERWAILLKTASVSEQDNAEKHADFELKTAATDAARAEVRRLERLKSFARITAPFAGIITVRNIDEGDLIVAAAGKEALPPLADTETQNLRTGTPGDSPEHPTGPGRRNDSSGTSRPGVQARGGPHGGRHGVGLQDPSG